MTNDQYAAVLTYLDLSHARIARMLGVSYRQAMRWKAGDTPVPGPVAGLLNVLVDIRRNDTPDDFDYVLKLIGG